MLFSTHTKLALLYAARYAGSGTFLYENEGLTALATIMPPTPWALYEWHVSVSYTRRLACVIQNRQLMPAVMMCCPQVSLWRVLE